jgi:hypothetical protein
MSLISIHRSGRNRAKHRRRFIEIAMLFQQTGVIQRHQDIGRILLLGGLHFRERFRQIAKAVVTFPEQCVRFGKILRVADDLSEILRNFRQILFQTESAGPWPVSM